MGRRRGRRRKRNFDRQASKQASGRQTYRQTDREKVCKYIKPILASFHLCLLFTPVARLSLLLLALIYPTGCSFAFTFARAQSESDIATEATCCCFRLHPRSQASGSLSGDAAQTGVSYLFAPLAFGAPAETSRGRGVRSELRQGEERLRHCVVVVVVVVSLIETELT